MADEDQTVDEGNDNLKELRKRADEARKLEQETNQLKRELAFSKAGIDVDTPVGKMLFKAYDGDLDKDTLVTAAREVGAINDAPATTDELPETERNQSRERADLASESGTASIHQKDPFQEAEGAFKEAVRDGAPKHQAFGAAMAKIVEAHQRGDSRVIPTGNRG